MRLPHEVHASRENIQKYVDTSVDLKVHTGAPCCFDVEPCFPAGQFCLAADLTMSCFDLKRKPKGGLAVIIPPLVLHFRSQ